MNATVPSLYWNGDYHVMQWMLLFFIYSFLGWIWESIYQSILEKKLLNRGFLFGPFIPLYGAGATSVLICTMPFKEHWWVVALVGMVVATVLEEITGRVMELLFDVRYWSYEGYPGNIDDIICIPATILWGAFSLFAMYILNPPFEHLLMQIPLRAMHRIVFFITIIFVVDVTLSVKDALDFKELLVKMDSTKKELARLKKRLDVMIAFYDDKHRYVAKLRTTITSPRSTLTDMVDSVRERLELLKEIRNSRRQEEAIDEMEQLVELQEIENEYVEQSVVVKQYNHSIKKYIKRLLHSHPGAKVRRLGVRIREAAISFGNYIASKRG